MANKKTKKTTNKYYLFLLLLFLATIFMGVGYASLFGVLLNIEGSGTVLTQDVVHISASTYDSDNGAVVASSNINDYFATTLNSTITLGNSSSSTITYSITIVNDTNDNYIYTGNAYDPDFYDNPNITFDVVGLTPGYKLDAHASKTFDITFRYTGTNTSNPVLNSYISFNFDKYYTITYTHINTTNKNYPTYFLDSETTKSFTFTGDVPADVSITPTVSYTYNNGTLTLNNIKNDITIDRYYSITYVTAGTNAQNQPTKYLHGSTVTFLTPVNGNNIFNGWYRNSSYSGNAITNTSGLNEDLTLYAKWINNSYEVATTFITSLVGDASTSSTNVITLTPPNNTCTNTLGYDNTNDKNLRYVGNNPCNYVKFNCDANDNCETWRIIGVINGIDSEPVIKIAKGSYESTTAVWDSSTKNTWQSSSLYSTLNTTYLNSLNDGVQSNYLLNAQWNIGGVTYTNQPLAAYNQEVATKSTAAYIGLISPSDFSYAIGGSNRSTCITTPMNSVSSACVSENYLFTSQHQWTISKRPNGNNQVVRISDVGKTLNAQSAAGNYNYRVVVHLKPNVLIDTENGDGSAGNPYILKPGS